MISPNIEDWEEIQFEDIRLGDTLAVVKVTDKGTVTVTSKTTDRSYYTDEWVLENGWKVNQRESQGIVTIYREKAKFVAPTGLGAVVKATNKNTKETFHLVFSDHTDRTEGWRASERGSWWSANDLTKHFESHEILSEGVIL